MGSHGKKRFVIALRYEGEREYRYIYATRLVWRTEDIIRTHGLRWLAKEYISKALWECLVAQDIDGFKDILKTHMELLDKNELVKRTGISKRTLFRMLSEEGNPTLENIPKLVNKLCA